MADPVPLGALPPAYRRRRGGGVADRLHTPHANGRATAEPTSVSSNLGPGCGWLGTCIGGCSGRRTGCHAHPHRGTGGGASCRRRPAPSPVSSRQQPSPSNRIPAPSRITSAALHPMGHAARDWGLANLQNRWGYLKSAVAHTLGLDLTPALPLPYPHTPNSSVTTHHLGAVQEPPGDAHEHPKNPTPTT